MDDNILRYTLRVNRTLFQKFRYVADYEGRSANREIEQYIKQRVKSFEEEHGEIEVKKIKHTHRLTPFRSISERVFLIKQNNFQLSIFHFQFTQETFLSPQLHRHDTTGLRFHALLPLRCGIFAFHRIPTTPVSYASAMKNNQTQGNNFPTFRMRSFFCNICYCGTKPLPHSKIRRIRHFPAQTAVGLFQPVFSFFGFAVTRIQHSSPSRKASIFTFLPFVSSPALQQASRISPIITF